MNDQKKNLDFEINLLPVISMLAVCICFLLISAIWIQMGTINVTQGLGDQTVEAGTNPSAIWAVLNSDGSFTLTAKDIDNLPASLNNVRVNRKGWKKLDRYVRQVKKYDPRIKTALVLPKASSSYNDVIQVLDRFKQNELKDVGISPL